MECAVKRASARFFVLSGVTALALASGAALVPAAASPAALFTLKVSGIDRDGTTVSVQPYVDNTAGVSYSPSGQSFKVPAGHYIVAAAIWRPADGDTQTLVARQVHVTGNTNVTLDAQGAVPVTASLSVPSVTQGDQTVGLCIGTDENSVVGYLVDSAGTAYVKPMSSSVLSTVYQTYYQDASGNLYDLAGAFKGGIPASPDYHGNPASMAKVNVELRDYENVTPLQSVIGTYDNCGTTTEPVSTLPSTYTDYRTAGDWTTDLNFGKTQANVQRDLYVSRDYKAGHTYWDTFGSAVAGPGADYPEIQDSSVVYGPGNAFSDPLIHVSFDCEGKATVTLSHGSTQVAKQKLTFCGAKNVFSKNLKKTGWYTLKSVANRWNSSGGSLPAGLLSTQVSLTWRFKFAPVTGHPINSQAAPVTVTKFEPQNLTSLNTAAGGTTTAIRVYVMRGGGQPVHTPRYKLKTLKFAVSYNGGATWQTLTATPHGAYWLIYVANPHAGGDIALRSTVTDVHGDATTETILNAYRALIP